MQIRNWFLVFIGIFLVGMCVFLILDSSGPQEIVVDAMELKNALAKHRKAISLVHSETVVEQTSTISTKKNKVAAIGSQKERKPAVRRVRTPSIVTEEIFLEKADIESRMNDANRFYDRADYEAATEAAIEILKEEPTNVRMLRIVVSCSCKMGDEDLAIEKYVKLPARDQRQMARRCRRDGMELEI